MPRHRATPDRSPIPNRTVPNRTVPNRGTPKHRAPSRRSGTFRGVTATVTATGAALGASALAAAPAYAASSPVPHLDSQHGDDQTGSHHRRYRPMTSGEEQYRNGCKQGYISDDCEQFSVTNLLRHGINPYL